jgi:hypothetical protein
MEIGDPAASAFLCAQSGCRPIGRNQAAFNLVKFARISKLKHYPSSEIGIAFQEIMLQRGGGKVERYTGFPLRSRVNIGTATSSHGSAADSIEITSSHGQ